MNDEKWIKWKMQTSENWADIKDVMYPINIDFIDHDHKLLVEYALQLNKLTARMDKDFSLESLENVRKLLEDLYSYAVQHFKREEVFMDRYQLPGVEGHKRIHTKILKMIRTYIDDFAKGRVAIGQMLRAQLMDWLINHINKIDYNFFSIKNWQDNLIEANGWDSVSDIISLVGIKSIDKEHRHITENAIDLFRRMDNHDKPYIISSQMELLIDEITRHFDNEEALMKKYDILDENHLRKHGEFISELKNMKTKIFDQSQDSKGFKLWMLSWWINHINDVDQKTFEADRWVRGVIQQSGELDDMLDLLRLTHIKGIDDDHIAVIELVLALYQCLDDPSNQEKNKQEGQVLDLLEKIYKRAEVHFAREEKIMQTYNLEDLASHTAEHKSLLAKIKELIDHYKEGRLMASANIKTMVLDWWINHTNNFDYRTFVIHVDPVVKQIISEEASDD